MNDREKAAEKYGQDNFFYSVGSQEEMLRRDSNRAYAEQGFIAGAEYEAKKAEALVEAVEQVIMSDKNKVDHWPTLLFKALKAYKGGELDG